MSARGVVRALSAIEEEMQIDMRFFTNPAISSKMAGSAVSRLQPKNQDGGFRCTPAKATVRGWRLRLIEAWPQPSLPKILGDG